MAKQFRVAVVGATGAVGREMVETVDQRDFPVEELVLLASARSLGQSVRYKGKEIDVEVLDDYDFEGIDIVLSSAGGSISKEFAPRAAKAGAVIVDNTSAFRMDADVPLVVPEVNPEAIAEFEKRNIIANPNCSTIQMLVALKPLHDAATITRIVVSTYQAVSGAGKKAMDELSEQTVKLIQGESAYDLEPKVFAHQIAFNALPHIDVFLDNGYTKEEMKMVNETHKIMDPNIKVTATCVRIPVFCGHSESVYIETERKLTADEARQVLSKAPGVTVMDNPGEAEYPLPIEATGKDDTYVGRIREDTGVENALNLWVVADNLRKGAALNAVQIAEILADQYL